MGKKKVYILIFISVLIHSGYAWSASNKEFVNYDSIQIIYYYTKGKSLMMKNPEESIRLLTEAEIRSLKSQKKYFLGDIYVCRGNAFRTLKDNASALRNYQSASNWYQRIHDSISLAGTYINLSRTFDDSGDSAGFDHYLALAEEICPNNSIAALSVKKTLLLNTGSFHFRKGRYRKALDYFERSLLCYHLINSQENIAIVYNNLAMAHNELNDDQKANAYADSALQFTLNDDTGFQLAIVYSTKADIALKHKQYAKAATFYLQSLEKTKKANYFGDLSTMLYYDLYTCYKELHDYKNALKYYLLHVQRKDSIYTMEKMTQFKKIETVYKLEQKNTTIASLSRQNQLKSELANRQSVIIIVVILSLALSIALTMAFIRYNSKIRRLNYLLRQKSKRILSQNKFIETQKRLLQIEAAKLGHENTIAHFEILKNQVNPHMLFNAMALLKSIIDKDKDTAKEFIDNLSDIFRQAFQLKKDLLVSVQEELRFVESYIHIIRKQYENCLFVEIDIPDNVKSYYIPPFSLQLIVENVIKHNELIESNPVHLKIYYKANAIHIENTVVKKKEAKVTGSGVGHQNLIERYKLISEKEPRFFADEKIFSVCLPLFINE